MESQHFPFLPFFFLGTLLYLYKNTSASIHYFQISSYRPGRSLSPTMSNPLFIPMFTGFLPSCAWSIKHPCVLAPLTSPAYLRVPEAKLRAHAGLMKQHALVAFADGPERKWLQSGPSSRQREWALPLIREARVSLHLSPVWNSDFEIQRWTLLWKGIFYACVREEAFRPLTAPVYRTTHSIKACVAISRRFTPKKDECGSFSLSNNSDGEPCRCVRHPTRLQSSHFVKFPAVLDCLPSTIEKWKKI